MTNESKRSFNVAIPTYDDRNDQADDQEAIIKKLVRCRFTVEPQNLKNCDLLHESIDNGLFTVVEDFLKHCGDINSEFFKSTSNVRRKGYTLLHTACERGHVNIVQLLLDKGAVIDATAENGKTPLMIAIMKEHKDIIKLLLNRGVNIDHQDKCGSTPLYYAALSGDVDTVELILKRRPDINTKGNRNSIRVAKSFYTKVASKRKPINKYDEIVEALYRYGFTINPDLLHDFELLEKAITYGSMRIVEDFLKYSAGDLVSHFMSARKCMPLHFAAKWNQKDVIKVMVKYGLDVNVKDDRGRTPLFHSIASSILHGNEDCADIVELLLQLGADPNVSDIIGKTPLHYVAACNVTMKKIVNLLVNRGANVDENCKAGKSPFSIAINQGNVYLQKLFLQHIVADFKNTSHRRLLLIASRTHSTLIFEAPLKSGADINSVSEDGKTSLHFAYRKKYDKLVIKLLEYGCDVSEMMLMLNDSKDSDNFLRDTKNILKTHIVKLVVAGLKKSDVTLYIPEGNTGLVDQCSRELQTMKNENVPHSAVPFRDILTEDATRLATYAKNDNLVVFLKSDECEKQFPLYSSLMKGFIWRGIVRKFLLEKSVNVFRSYTGIFRELPDICVEHILNYLNDGDLRTFIQFVCGPIKVGN